MSATTPLFEDVCSEDHLEFAFGGRSYKAQLDEAVKKTKKFWTLKPGDGNPYWGPAEDRKGVFQPKKSKKAKKLAKEAKKMEVVEVSDDDDEMDDAENAIIDEMNDAENDIIDIVNKMSDGKAKFFLARSIESAFMKVKGMKANASKKRKGAQPTIFKKPVGRPPKGKQWCTATGKWRDTN